MLLVGIVVDDGVDRFALWQGSLGDIEKADRVLMPVTLHAVPDHRAVQHIGPTRLTNAHPTVVLPPEAALNPPGVVPGLFNAVGQTEVSPACNTGGRK